MNWKDEPASEVQECPTCGVESEFRLCDVVDCHRIPTAGLPKETRGCDGVYRCVCPDHFYAQMRKKNG